MQKRKEVDGMGSFSYHVGQRIKKYRKSRGYTIEQFSAGRAYYTVHYFPFGTLGMSYSLTDGFCQENPLTGLQ